ncbi:MAG: ATP-binding protein, partial [Smithellaceae bacterium]
MSGPKFRETRLNKIINESLTKLSKPAGVNVVLSSALKDDAVWLDEEQMSAVLLDLAKNALESMPRGGELKIDVTGDDEQVTVALTDEGVGIPLENIPLLFTPFFTTKAVGDGTGLGLPLAYATVKAHKGDIVIESNANPQERPTGTVVRITL